MDDYSKVIAIEGPDGVGKTTLVNKLVDYFNNCTSYSAVVISPSNTSLGLNVKSIIKETSDIHPDTMTLLQLATLRHAQQHIERLQEEAEANKRKLIVFLDRWYVSTGVYQNYVQRNKDFPFFTDEPCGCKSLLNPDDIYILDAGDELLDKRLAERKDLEKFEARDFQRKVREGYRKIFEYGGHRYIQFKVTNDTDDNVRRLLQKIINSLM